jgi:hypothetical protein
MRPRTHRHRGHWPYRTHQYYTCRSCAHYGTKAGCDIHRFNADDLEPAIGQALLDFYTTGHDLITDAIALFQQTHAASSAAKRQQLAAVKNQIKDNAAAVDRYLTAFERGTLNDDEPAIQARLSSLKTQAKALRARKAELDLDLEAPPQALTPEDLGHHPRRDPRHPHQPDPQRSQGTVREADPRDPNHRRRHGPAGIQAPHRPKR